ncbi:MAG: adenylate/guanylate cyclase domain-containing protein [Microthrixaceae bacterium]
MTDGELRYADTSDGSVAYRQLPGSGNAELVFMLDAWFAMGSLYEDRLMARFLDGLRELGDLVVFDRLGSGLSDPPPDWDGSAADRLASQVEAVVSDAGLTEATVVAEMFGSPAAVLAAARSGAIRQLVLVHPYNPWLWDLVGHELLEGSVQRVSDDGWTPVKLLAPERARDPVFVEWFESSFRSAMSPKQVRQTGFALSSSDRDELRTHYHELTTPTLLLRSEDAWSMVPLEDAERADQQIPTSRRVHVPGPDQLSCGSSVEPCLAEITRFVAGEDRHRTAERVVQGLLYTDVGGSTEAASQAGDERWAGLMAVHDRVSDQVVSQLGGRVVRTTGDGIVAVLPSATSALRAAVSISSKLAARGLHIRAGVHVGDVEPHSDDLTGLSLNIAARVMNEADPGEIYLTESTRIAALGAGFATIPVGSRELKGLEGSWELHALQGPR